MPFRLQAMTKESVSLPAPEIVDVTPARNNHSEPNKWHEPAKNGLLCPFPQSSIGEPLKLCKNGYCGIRVSQPEDISALSDEQVAEIEAFCAEVHEGLEYATFEDKQRYLELLDMRGTVA